MEQTGKPGDFNMASLGINQSSSRVGINTLRDMQITDRADAISFLNLIASKMPSVVAALNQDNVSQVLQASAAAINSQQQEVEIKDGEVVPVENTPVEETKTEVDTDELDKLAAIEKMKAAAGQEVEEVKEVTEEVIEKAKQPVKKAVVKKPVTKKKAVINTVK